MLFYNLVNSLPIIYHTLRFPIAICKYTKPPQHFQTFFNPNCHVIIHYFFVARALRVPVTPLGNETKRNAATTFAGCAAGFLVLLLREIL